MSSLTTAACSLRTLVRNWGTATTLQKICCSRSFIKHESLVKKRFKKVRQVFKKKLEHCQGISVEFLEIIRRAQSLRMKNVKPETMHSLTPRNKVVSGCCYLHSSLLPSFFSALKFVFHSPFLLFPSPLAPLFLGFLELLTNKSDLILQFFLTIVCTCMLMEQSKVSMNKYFPIHRSGLHSLVTQLISSANHRKGTLPLK